MVDCADDCFEQTEVKVKQTEQSATDTSSVQVKETEAKASAVAKDLAEKVKQMRSNIV